MTDTETTETPEEEVSLEIPEGSDPANVNYREDMVKRAEAEAYQEAASREAQAEKSNQETGQGTPLPTSNEIPPLMHSSPVSRDQLPTETQREGQELELAWEQEPEVPVEEEEDPTVEPA